MKLKPTDFNNDNEVDFLARYQANPNDKPKRLSMRRNAVGNYELFTFDYHTKQESVLYSGSLRDAVSQANTITGYKDKVFDS